MPLVRAGEIVTPAWLLKHPDDGFKLITGLLRISCRKGVRKAGSFRLKQRADEVHRRLKTLEIEVDAPSLRLYLLSTSRPQLVELYDEQRRMLPDSEHRGIAALLERPILRDEDLIILLSAAKSQSCRLKEAVAAASQLARRAGVTSFDQGKAGEWLLLPRRNHHGPA